MPHPIDFLHPRRTPWLGWLLLLAGALALAATLRLDRQQQQARAAREALAARREHDAAQARLRLEAAARPTPQGRRLAAALAQTRLPWLPTLQAVEAATAPPLYVLGFTIDPAKGRVRLDGEAPDFDQAVAYVERLRAADATASARLASHEQVTDAASARVAVKFAVEAAWGPLP